MEIAGERESEGEAVRMWTDDRGRVLTDEQLLRQLAYYGSLESALSRGDVRLLASSEEGARQSRRSPDGPRRTLKDYLEED